MSENIAESEAAKSALNNEQSPPGMEGTEAAPSDGGANGGDGLEDQNENAGEQLDFRQAVKETWFLDITLFREDKANEFNVSYKECAEFIFKRLGVEQGHLHSVDTSPYKKITLELDNRCVLGNLNLTQSIQIRSGLWTRPLQAPEKDRPVYIKWAPMKMPSADIESVLKWFGTITHEVNHVVLRDTGHDDWTALMEGVKTAERTCRMKIQHNIPSLILVRGVKVRIDYPGQPKTCTRCLKFWSACPGGGKVEKCKKENGEERDIKNVFKNFLNRLKKKQGGEAEIVPVIPENIPNPDQIKFTGFPEDFKLVDFKLWLDENAVNFLEPMLFKESKPGVFSISTVEEEGGELLKVEADEAAEIVQRLNGIQFESSNKRIMVTMVALTTPEKKKPIEVVKLDDSDPSDPAQLALPEPEAAAASGEGAQAAAQPEAEADSDEDLLVETESEDDETKLKKSLKLNISAAYTKGGTKTHRVTGAKSKREESDTSLEASPPLKTQTNTQPRSNTQKGKGELPKDSAKNTKAKDAKGKTTKPQTKKAKQ